MIFPVATFKADLIEFLKADTACAALFGARVYDSVPQDLRGATADLTVSPWAYLGAITLRRVPMDCGPVFMANVRVFVASNKAGRDEIWNAANAVADALELATVSDVQNMPGYVDAAGDILDELSIKTAFVDFSASITGLT